MHATTDNPSRRIATFLCVAIVTGALCVFTWLAIRWGIAGVILDNTASDLEGWQTTQGSTGEYPSNEAWQKAHIELKKALQLEPASPAVLEALGLLHLQRASSNTDLQISPVNALPYLRRAATARPTSSYTWSNIMQAKYQAGQIDSELYQAMQRAMKLGPWEPEVQLSVTNIGFALWDEMPAGLQAPVRQIAEQSTRRHAMEILQIAINRGRLDAVCAWEKLAGELPCRKIRS